MDTVTPPVETWPEALRRGLAVSWQSIALIAALNTAIALALWVEDPRPFWHPLVSVQISGFAIAYCVNVAAPWTRPRAIPRLVLAVALGSAIALVLIILVKRYDLAHVTGRWTAFAWNFAAAFFNGLFFSLFYYVRAREARAEAALHQAEAERNRLARQAAEAELRLMQAQVEPHFLFNTLASVQFLTETDPPAASRLLGHLIDYLRAALPQLRAATSTLGREFELAQSYLAILQTRMGPRLAVTVDLPADLRDHAFPPNMLISLVENAIKHGLEPAAAGGTLSLTARRLGERVVVAITDTGRGIAGSVPAGGGFGLANIRERLETLFGARARFALEPVAPAGTRAMIEIPYAPGA